MPVDVRVGPKLPGVTIVQMKEDVNSLCSSIKDIILPAVSVQVKRPSGEDLLMKWV